MKAFTLVELLVVLFIISLLVAVLVVAGSSVFDDAKRRETKTVMVVLEQAVNQFRDDAPLKKVAAYRARYGDFPCDELDGFDRGLGIPGPAVSIGPGAMSTLVTPGNSLANVANRDIKAMTLVIKLYSPEAVEFLDKVPGKYRRNPTRPAEEFFDRDGETDLDTDDEPLTYYVDAWGQPFEYLAIRDNTLPPATLDAPAGYRRSTSAFAIEVNHDAPLLFSYGADGADQLEGHRALFPTGPSPFVVDFSDLDTYGTPGRVDNTLNDDNVYIDDSVRDRLRAGELD